MFLFRDMNACFNIANKSGEDKFAPTPKGGVHYTPQASSYREESSACE